MGSTMKDARCLTRLALANLILLTVFIAPLPAASPANAQTAAEADCRDAIAKNTAKYVQAVLKTLERCHNKRARGKLPASVDCNELAQADPSNRLEKQRARVRSAIQADCGPAASLLLQYARCPSPAHLLDDGGATDGIDSYAEVADCMLGLAEGLTEKTAPETLGAPAAALSKDPRRCLVNARGPGSRKLLKAVAAEAKRCQSDRDRSSLGLGFECSGADPRGKVAKTRAKLDKKLAKLCAMPDPFVISPGNEAIDAIGGCGDTVEQLQQCIGDIVEKLGSGLTGAAYGLPADCRAGSVVRSLHSGFGNQLTATELSAGWNGLGHKLDFFDQFSELVDLDCDADCANCAVTYNPAVGRPGLDNCRCVLDASQTCDTINGPDIDDCGVIPGQNLCRCYFGPPLPVNSAGVPACVPITIESDYTGTADLGGSHWSNVQQVAAVIHLGEQLLTPCPACVGDDVPNDGVRNGTCVGGSRANLACDQNGNHPTFGEISIDCQPISLKNISGGGLLLNFELISAEQELVAELPCDNPAETCACRVCSGESTIGCRNDAECPVGTGTCTGGGGAGVQPNDCDNHDCGDNFECTTGPDNTYCDGVTHPSGRGAIACNTPADCQAFGAGQCTVVERLSCYPDPIPVGGEAGIFGMDVGGLACIGLTTSPAINVASGLPGAVRVAVNFDLDQKCETDPLVSWHPPAGANCPVLAGTPCGDTVPLCDGACPGGQTCTVSGLACVCQ